ncbi:MAG: hypothetical protein HY892_06055 [Deltaproteobacteria bacterium]|nr:hypothetical protein [Deltaproteobacteria bacterium]
MSKNLKGWSTGKIVAGSLLLSALPLAAVEMFPASLMVVLGRSIPGFLWGPWWGYRNPKCPDSLKTPIFPISQEALNHIAKHSQASSIKT